MKQKQIYYIIISCCEIKPIQWDIEMEIKKIFIGLQLLNQIKNNNKNVNKIKTESHEWDGNSEHISINS